MKPSPAEVVAAMQKVWDHGSAYRFTEEEMPLVEWIDESSNVAALIKELAMNPPRHRDFMHPYGCDICLTHFSTRQDLMDHACKEAT